MRALLVIDVQNAIVTFKDFNEELKRIKEIIKEFKKNKEPVIFIRNLEDDETSLFYKNSKSSELHYSLREFADIIIEKSTPSAFFKTDLSEILENLGVNHLFITGFNTEFCCQFTAIAAYDRGYQVTFIEDATGTVNDGVVYETEGLDVRDFIGTVLHWSNSIEVIDVEEYNDKYRLGI